MAKSIEQIEKQIEAKAASLKRLKGKIADRRREVERLIGQIILNGNPSFVPDLVKELATDQQKKRLEELGFAEIHKAADAAHLKRKGFPTSTAPAPRAPVMPASDSEPARLQEFVRQNP